MATKVTPKTVEIEFDEIFFSNCSLQMRSLKDTMSFAKVKRGDKLLEIKTTTEFVKSIVN